jgi:hypothetical protein
LHAMLSKVYWITNEALEEKRGKERVPVDKN